MIRFAILNGKADHFSPSLFRHSVLEVAWVSRSQLTLPNNGADAWASSFRYSVLNGDTILQYDPAITAHALEHLADPCPLLSGALCYMGVGSSAHT